MNRSFYDSQKSQNLKNEEGPDSNEFIQINPMYPTSGSIIEYTSQGFDAQDQNNADTITRQYHAASSIMSQQEHEENLRLITAEEEKLQRQMQKFSIMKTQHNHKVIGIDMGTTTRKTEIVSAYNQKLVKTAKQAHSPRHQQEQSQKLLNKQWDSSQTVIENSRSPSIGTPKRQRTDEKLFNQTMGQLSVTIDRVSPTPLTAGVLKPKTSNRQPQHRRLIPQERRKKSNGTPSNYDMYRFNSQEGSIQQLQQLPKQQWQYQTSLQSDMNSSFQANKKSEKPQNVNIDTYGQKFFPSLVPSGYKGFKVPNPMNFNSRRHTTNPSHSMLMSSQSRNQPTSMTLKPIASAKPVKKFTLKKQQQKLPYLDHLVVLGPESKNPPNIVIHDNGHGSQTDLVTQEHYAATYVQKTTKQLQKLQKQTKKRHGSKSRSPSLAAHPKLNMPNAMLVFAAQNSPEDLSKTIHNDKRLQQLGQLPAHEALNILLTKIIFISKAQDSQYNQRTNRRHNEEIYTAKDFLKEQKKVFTNLKQNGTPEEIIEQAKKVAEQSMTIYKESPTVVIKRLSIMLHNNASSPLKSSQSPHKSPRGTMYDDNLYYLGKITKDKALLQIEKLRSNETKSWQNKKAALSINLKQPILSQSSKKQQSQVSREELPSQLHQIEENSSQQQSESMRPNSQPNEEVVAVSQRRKQFEMPKTAQTIFSQKVGDGKRKKTSFYRQNEQESLDREHHRTQDQRSQRTGQQDNESIHSIHYGSVTQIEDIENQIMPGGRNNRQSRLQSILPKMPAILTGEHSIKTGHSKKSQVKSTILSAKSYKTPRICLEHDTTSKNSRYKVVKLKGTNSNNTSKKNFNLTQPSVVSDKKSVVSKQLPETKLSEAVLPKSISKMSNYNEDNNITAPYSIAKYQGDTKTCDWVCKDPHPDYSQLFKGFSFEGGNDWNGSFHRLTQPGHSNIIVNFDIPVEQIRHASPNAYFILRTAYFSAWQTSSSIVSVKINGEVVLKSVLVLSEDQGLTVHDTVIGNLKEDENTVEIIFENGDNELFLSQFELLVSEQKQPLKMQEQTQKDDITDQQQQMLVELNSIEGTARTQSQVIVDQEDKLGYQKQASISYDSTVREFKQEVGVEEDPPEAAQKQEVDFYNQVRLNYLDKSQSIASVPSQKNDIISNLIIAQPDLVLQELLPMLSLDDMANLYIANSRTKKLLTPSDFASIDFAELLHMMLHGSIGPNKMIVLTRLQEQYNSLPVLIQTTRGYLQRYPEIQFLNLEEEQAFNNTYIRTLKPQNQKQYLAYGALNDTDELSNKEFFATRFSKIKDKMNGQQSFQSVFGMPLSQQKDNFAVIENIPSDWRCLRVQVYFYRQINDVSQIKISACPMGMIGNDKAWVQIYSINSISADQEQSWETQIALTEDFLGVDYALRLNLHSTPDDSGNLPLFEGFGITKIQSAEIEEEVIQTQEETISHVIAYELQNQSSEVADQSKLEDNEQGGEFQQISPIKMPIPMEIPILISQKIKDDQDRYREDAPDKEIVEELKQKDHLLQLIYKQPQAIATLLPMLKFNELGQFHHLNKVCFSILDPKEPQGLQFSDLFDKYSHSDKIFKDPDWRRIIAQVQFETKSLPKILITARMLKRSLSQLTEHTVQSRVLAKKTAIKVHDESPLVTMQEISELPVQIKEISEKPVQIEEIYEPLQEKNQDISLIRPVNAQIWSIKSKQKSKVVNFEDEEEKEEESGVLRNIITRENSFDKDEETDQANDKLIELDENLEENRIKILDAYQNLMAKVQQIEIKSEVVKSFPPMEKQRMSPRFQKAMARQQTRVKEVDNLLQSNTFSRTFTSSSRAANNIKSNNKNKSIRAPKVISLIERPWQSGCKHNKGDWDINCWGCNK